MEKRPAYALGVRPDQLRIARPLAHGRLLGLGPLPPPRGEMLGVEVGTDDDGALFAGFPELLARALTRVARVTFLREPIAPPLPKTWEARGEDHVLELPLGAGRAWTRRLTERLGFAETRGLVSTRRPASAVALFESDYFWWNMQAQVVILSAPDAPPPPVSATLLDALFEDDWTVALGSIAEGGVVGGMRPGTDGVLAGIAALAPGFGDACLDAITREAEAANQPVRIVTNEDFP